MLPSSQKINAVIHYKNVLWQLIAEQLREESLFFPKKKKKKKSQTHGHSVLQFLDTQSSFLFLLINPHWPWLTYVRKKGASFGVQLPRDGMKILQWSSNPKLPSKNIPLPPRRDPDLFACRAEAGRGWAAPTRGQAGGRWGQADGRSGQVQFTGLGRPQTWGPALFYHRQEGISTVLCYYCLLKNVFKLVRTLYMNSLRRMTML